MFLARGYSGPKQNPDTNERFDWRTSVYELRVPVIQSLFQQVASPAQLGPLGSDGNSSIVPADTLNRIRPRRVLCPFRGGSRCPVFSTSRSWKRLTLNSAKRWGVWYTPRDIVRYQVARVDAVLKSETGHSGRSG